MAGIDPVCSFSSSEQGYVTAIGYGFFGKENVGFYTSRSLTACHVDTTVIWQGS